MNDIFCVFFSSQKCILLGHQPLNLKHLLLFPYNNNATMTVALVDLVCIIFQQLLKSLCNMLVRIIAVALPQTRRRRIRLLHFVALICITTVAAQSVRPNSSVGLFLSFYNNIKNNTYIKYG